MDIKIKKTDKGAEMEYLDNNECEINFESIDSLIDKLLSESINLDDIKVSGTGVDNYVSLINGIISEMKKDDFQEAYKLTLEKTEEVN